MCLRNQPNSISISSQFTQANELSTVLRPGANQIITKLNSHRFFYTAANFRKIVGIWNHNDQLGQFERLVNRRIFMTALFWGAICISKMEFHLYKNMSALFSRTNALFSGDQKNKHRLTVKREEEVKKRCCFASRFSISFLIFSETQTMSIPMQKRIQIKYTQKIRIFLSVFGRFFWAKVKSLLQSVTVMM